jgi:hypothetical protein
MENVTTKVVGNKLTIEIDLSKRFGPSGSGKTIIVASTRGAVKVGNVSLALNCYTKEASEGRRVADAPLADMSKFTYSRS